MVTEKGKDRIQRSKIRGSQKVDQERGMTSLAFKIGHEKFDRKKKEWTKRGGKKKKEEKIEESKVTKKE